MTTRSLLEGTTMDRLLHYDTMKDNDKLTAMKFLNSAALYAHALSDQKLFPLIVFRMVQLTVNHGVCRESAFAMATYGMILCLSEDEIKLGYCFGKLSLSLLERFNAKEQHARVFAVVYQFINPFVEPQKACLIGLVRGYEDGMLMGETEWAMINCHCYVFLAFLCGSELESLAKTAKSYLQQMREFKLLWFSTVPVCQAIENLTTNTGDPTKIEGREMQEKDFLARTTPQNGTALQVFYVMQMWLAFYFGKYELAASSYEKLGSVIWRQRLRGASIVKKTFLSGLIAMALMRKEGKQKKWVCVAKRALSRMKVWAENSSWNFEHKLQLLVAEWAFFNGHIEKAAKAYDLSIHSASQHGFIHEQALACEKAAQFSAALGNYITAKEYLTKSHGLYIQWGAKRKAEHILDQLGIMNELG